MLQSNRKLRDEYMGSDLERTSEYVSRFQPWSILDGDIRPSPIVPRSSDSILADPLSESYANLISEQKASFTMKSADDVTADPAGCRSPVRVKAPPFFAWTLRIDPPSMEELLEVSQDRADLSLLSTSHTEVKFTISYSIKS